MPGGLAAEAQTTTALVMAEDGLIGREMFIPTFHLDLVLVLKGDLRGRLLFDRIYLGSLDELDPYLFGCVLDSCRIVYSLIDYVETSTMFTHSPLLRRPNHLVDRSCCILASARFSDHILSFHTLFLWPTPKIMHNA